MKLINSFRLVVLLLTLTVYIVEVESTTNSPTELPTVNPSVKTTTAPSADPTLIPTRHPTVSPTIMPTVTPTLKPTLQPSTKPTPSPSIIPTLDPTPFPTADPTVDPTTDPTIDPTISPTIDPTILPTPVPTIVPSLSPTLHPTVTPTVVPTSQPSSSPSGQPSGSPTSGPTSPPSTQPSSRPSGSPSSQPSSFPSTHPSTRPSSLPSGQPTSSPSAQPIMHPTSKPSSQPSGQPSSIPSTHPLSCPTSQPSAQPTVIPSNQPTNRPTLLPTSQPSAQPSALPSMQPTSKPSTCPSAQPTALPSTAPQSRPTSQPSSQPTGTPSSEPTGQPTARPSACPTTQPSSIPTTTPSALPSTQPSSSPSSVPSGQPSATPSSEPTAQPSCAPSAQPTSSPSSLPSGQPTDMPTGLPLSAPTSRPTQQPSSQPSSSPSRQPTGTPTTAPSGVPTVIPSQQPSSSPTCQPSEQPSTAPTGQPSMQPTEQPSSAPSQQPSVQPSSQPSSQPFSVPTSQPSAAPTGYANTRYYRCNGQFVCEGQTDSTCSFFTPSSVLECVDSRTACIVATGVFSIGPNSTVSVQGGCELVVNASSTITIGANSTLRGSALSLSAQKDIYIYGQLSTTGRGPLYGPGAPGDGGLGNGGSYGGSGGQAQCDFTFYSAIPYQIGSIDVYNDLGVNSSNYAAAFGSGGGAPGAGMGGGRITLSTQSTVYIYPTGVIAASGSSAVNTTLGGGSGGSISIVAQSLSQDGHMEAVGGQAWGGNYANGAAGGGGRIAISIASGNIFDLAMSRISYHGGNAFAATTNTTSNASTRVCAVGGAGTLFIQLRSSETGKSTAAAIVSSNNNLYTYATTLLHNLPAQTTGIAASDLAIIAPSNGSIVLPSLSTCTLAKIHTASCSFFYMRNAELITLGNASSIDTTTSSLFSVDSMQIEGSKITGVRNSLYAVNILTKSFDLSDNSTMEFTESFKLVSKYYATIKGHVLQQPHYKGNNKDSIAYSERALLQVSSTGNITVGNMSTANMVLNSNRVIFAVGSNVFKPSALRDTSCMFNVTQVGLLCHDFNFRPVNNTYVIVGTASISVRDASVIRASQLLLCAPMVKIQATAMLSTSYHGCSPNAGYGRGGLPINSAGRGGGGGGYGGTGGQGYNAANSGIEYASHYSMSSGSGGGSLLSNASFGSSAGGGIISIVANTTLLMNGNLTADGGDGQVGTGAGGGSGGAIFINALGMSGAGFISAKGGVGGAYQYAGGGGGGGAVSLYSSVQNFETYTFTGYVNVNGGAAGTDAMYSTSSTATSPFSAVVHSIAPSVARSLRLSAPSTVIGYSGSAATAGGNGVKFLPQCQAGYGNNPTTGAICEECPVGTYSLGQNSGPCTVCNNAPTHSHYLETGCTTAKCPYACDAGYATNHCYNQIQNLIYNRMGVPAFAGMCVGIFLLLMVPLTYQRLKRRYDWFAEDKYKKQKNKKRDLFGIDIFARDSFNDYDDDDIVIDKSSGKHENMIKMQNFTTENPVLTAHKSRDSGNMENITKIRILRNKMFAERRREHRMNDQDLVFHAYRINLLGNNNPWSFRGSPWHMPIYRPACLRPLLKRTEYRQLAERVNAQMGWPLFTWEMLVLLTVSLLAPPLAAYIMKQYRRRRANVLLKIIATYDYSCFRCPRQRAAQNSLRIGISPDSTLAYIDVLYDEESFHRRVKPLCPIGQVRLPASFKVAGLGTYFSPYYIDTNDLILQAVPQTDIPSSFINDSWISFVIRLNSILRTIQANSIHLGVYKLIRFLSDDKHKVELGGLVVEFCTFPTAQSTYATERRYEDQQREIEQNANTSTVITTTVPNASVQVSIPSGTNISMRHNHTNNSDDNTERERESKDRLDSFGFNTGARKSEEGGWFSNLLDVNMTSPWATSKHPPSGARRPTSLREIELRDSVVKTSSFQPSDFSATDQERNLSAVDKITASNINTTSTTANTTSSSSRSTPANMGYVESILYYFYGAIAYYLASGYKPSDPAGKTLNFHEMCSAIQEGSLSMGILVTHPKVDQNNYIMQDEDYESEDSEFYEEEDDEEQEMLLVNNPEMEFSSGSDYENISKTMSSDTEVENSNPFHLASTTATTPSAGVDVGGSSVRTMSNASTEMSLSLQRVYGDKAEEMQKFYNIMLTAEAAQAAQAAGKSSSGMSLTDTPMAASKYNKEDTVIANDGAELNTSEATEQSVGNVSEEEAVSVRDETLGAANEKSDPSQESPAPIQRRSTLDSVPEPVPRLSVADATEGCSTTARMLEFADFRHSTGSVEEGNTAALAVISEQQEVQQVKADDQNHPVEEPQTSKLSATVSPSVRPAAASLLTRGDSTRSVNLPKAASEYTEFRPTTRDRKTSISTPNKDSVIRFSEFRHSNVVNDRFSEFRHSNVIDDRISDYEYYNSTAIEKKDESETHNVLEGPEDSSDSPRSGRDRGRSEVSATRGRGTGGVVEENRGSSMRMTHMSHKSHRQRSGTNSSSGAHNAGLELISSPLALARTQHTKQHRSNKRKTKERSRKPHHNQRDFSQQSLAPSAHQQEFNAWRLVSTTPVPHSSTTGNLANRFLTPFATSTTPAAANAEDTNPLHMRSSVMADRSSMITGVDDQMLDGIEEGDGRVVYDNPICSGVSISSTRNLRPVSTATSSTGLPISLADRSRIAPMHNHSNDSSDRKAYFLDFIQLKRMNSASPNELDTNSLDNANSRLSNASSVDHTVPAVMLTSTAAGNAVTSTTLITPLHSIEEHFKAVYYSRRIVLFLSRFMFGGNVYPLGPPYIRSLLEGILLVLSLADMALGSIICFEYYCVSGDITSCRNHDVLYLILGLWPLAMIITPILGVFAIMLGPSGTLTRIYAMWNRLTGVNNLIILVTFFQHYQYFTHLAITTYPPILYTCSRALQCLLVDQYIAHIERLRYTRGWDGLHTSLFKTQDNKVVVT